MGSSPGQRVLRDGNCSADTANIAGQIRVGLPETSGRAAQRIRLLRLRCTPAEMYNAAVLRSGKTQRFFAQTEPNTVFVWLHTLPIEYGHSVPKELPVDIFQHISA